MNGLLNHPGVQFVLLLAVFMLVAGVPMGLAWWGWQRARAQRLSRVMNAEQPATREAPSWVETIVRAATPLARVSVPDEGWEGSALRRRFIQAGLRDPRAPVLFFAVKTLLSFGVPLAMLLARFSFGGAMSTEAFFLLVSGVSATGFYAPNIFLRHRTARRRNELVDAFPDALDLLTICVEAGLSLEAAFNRVAAEIALTSPVLAEEMQLLCLELRAGGKVRALRGFALRTGVEDIDALVATLIQAEKFGTSVGESLRIQADMLRVKRTQRAEERAAKVAVKLLFPLLLCIFPAIMVVVVAPAILRIGRTLPGVVGG